jgi:anti-sigma B factor antagonist
MAGAARLLVHPIREVTIVNFQDTSILDTAQIEQIGSELYAYVDDRGCKRLILDFTKVQFLSSSALGLLITLHKKVAAVKGALVLCGLRKDLMKIFEITNLAKIFTFKPDEKEALAVFGVTTAG